ncbi:MAG TPA: glutathione-disulfide reductase [Geminicoccaceae bacterium]
MSSEPFDLFIIGAGSGGVRAARMAGQRGLRVAVAEDAALGGTCVNLGCIPKKLYSYAAHHGDAFEESRGFGWHAEEAPSFDWETLKANRRVEITRLNRIYESLLAGAGATLLRGRGRLLDATHVDVGGRVFAAERILIATGGRPVVLAVPGSELAMTSNEMFDLPRFPDRLVVIGGGYIACEFASIFRGLGAEVTLLHRGERILRGFDGDVRSFVSDEMTKKGVHLQRVTRIDSLERVGEGTRVAFVDAEGVAHTVDAATVLAATGRAPNTVGLGLEEVGVRLTVTGAVAVDEGYRSSVEGIFAIGDVIDRLQLTPVALAEATVLVDAWTGRGVRQLDYERVPTAVFTHPNVGTVGLTEAAARERFGEVRIFRTEFRPLRHTLSGSTERTLMKLVVEAATDRVVGLHMVGAAAGATVQGFAVALQAGATKAQFDATIGIHPTAAEEFVTMREPVKPIA